jgi:2-dehydro-3-deoxyphosphogluconate aldolase / (4S)-4-hydroxy-2-oxoglutarate aldolase
MSFVIIGIARGISKEDLIPSFEAAVDGGIRHLEVTMNTDNAAGLIEIAVKRIKGRASIGAGTVVTINDLHKALDSGAEFIVTPVVNEEVIRYCGNNKIPVYPGALTPTEIYKAWDAGATMVKVFPINRVGGAEYIKDIKGPFNEIKILACNGVTPENLKDYLACQADGIAIAGQLFDKTAIKNKNYSKIKEDALKFTSQIKNHDK